MEKIKADGTCPMCAQGKLGRIKRKGWMRLIPRTKFYQCPNCYNRFLQVLSWQMQLPRAV